MVSDQDKGDAPHGNGAAEATPFEETPPSMPSTLGGHHVVALLDLGMAWIDQILDYLQNQATLDDDVSVEAVTWQDHKYSWVGGYLYRQRSNDLLLIMHHSERREHSAL